MKGGDGFIAMYTFFKPSGNARGMLLLVLHLRMACYKLSIAAPRRFTVDGRLKTCSLSKEKYAIGKYFPSSITWTMMDGNGIDKTKRNHHKTC